MTIRVVVPISGGKDSQACLRLATEHYPLHEIRGLFCDTNFEHPKTYAHVEKLRTLYGPIQIDTVCGGNVLGEVMRYKRFPGNGARHCTEWLKIRESRIYYNALSKLQGGFEVWYGMRSDESNERKTRYAGKVQDELYPPHEVMKKYPKYLAKQGVVFRLPVLDWGTQDVYDYVGRENLNPLYDDFDRVGCFPCLAAGDAHKEKAFSYDDHGKTVFVIVQEVSKAIGKNVFTSKGGQARNASSGCSFCNY